MIQALQSLSEMKIEEVFSKMMEGNMSDKEATAAAALIEAKYPTPNRLN
jgi:anthranilate phosphoribosyltransferase